MPEHRALRRAGILCALATLLAGRAAAQSGSEPQLTFSILGGITGSGGELWTIPRQPLYVIGTNPAEFDTLKVARYLRPGIAATLGATYMRSPHLGFTGEVGYFDIESEQRCDSSATYQPDPAAESKNAQACTNAQGAHVPTSLFGIQLGASWRFTSEEKKLQPYIRASAGVGFLSNSFVLTEANVQAPTTCASANSICTIVIVDGESTPELGFLATLAAGASMTISPGYRFRFEARDLIAQLPAPERPANPATALAPVTTVIRHIPVFTAGIDVVLERRRGRRY